MISISKTPCDELIIDSKESNDCAQNSKFWVLVTSILGSSIAFVNGSVVNVALPAIQTAFDGSVADMQWIVNGYTIVLAALILVGGSLGDIYGRKKMFGFGVLIFAVASVWSGFSTSVSQLILARILQGIGGALLIPNSLALVSSAYPKEERGKAIGTWSAFSAITTAIGPILGGWLVDSFSWRPVFFISIPIALTAFIILFLKVPEFKDDTQSQSLDWKGAVLASLGFGSLSIGLIQASELGFFHPLVLGALIGGLILLFLFIFNEKTTSDPMMPMVVFKSKSFSGINLVTLLIYFALSGVFFFLPFNLIQVQGYSATEAGAVFLPFTFTMGVLSRWSGGLVDRYGERLPLVIGPIITALGYYMLSIPEYSTNFFTSFFPGLMITGIGMAITVSPLTTAVMNSVENHQTGIASGVNNSVSRLAGMLAVAILGLVAVQTFSAELMSNFDTVQLPVEIKNSIQAQSIKLAGISLSDSYPLQQKLLAQEIINDSFIASFQLLMKVSALITLIGAAISWFTLKGKD